MKKRYILFLTVFIILLKAESQIRLTAGDNTVLNQNKTSQENPAEDIFAAVKNGDLNALKKAAHKDTQLSALIDSTGNSLLHFAAALSDTALVKYLVLNKCDVNSRSNSAETPLHIATKYKNQRIIKILIANGAQLDVLDAANRTPLTNAIHHNETAKLTEWKFESVKALVENGADINQKGMWNWLPAQVAAEFGSEDIVNFMLDRGAVIPVVKGEASYQLFNAACSKGYERLFEKMLNDGFDLQVNAPNGVLLHAAAAGGSRKIVEKILAKGFKVMTGDFYGWSPLHSAAEKGRLEVVELLLDKGAEINDRNGSGSTPYNLATYFGHRAVCDLLLSRGADSTRQQFPVLSGNYFGQKEPEGRPRIMAADIVSTRYDLHGNIVFSKDADLAFWSGWFPVKGRADKTDQMIMTAKIVNGKWTKPEIASFSQPGSGDDSPFITPDGNKLFFVSERPLKTNAAKSSKENIWFVTRHGDSWSEPQPLKEVNHLNLHWQLSADKKGNLYFGARDPEEKDFGEIFCSDLINGKYQQPRKLSSSINSENSEGSPYISPDGDYLLFDRSTSFGQQMGIYISFRNSDGSWTKAVPIAEKAKIYPESHCPRVTSDGKYLFYMSWLGTSSAAFWTKADFINELR